MRHLDLLPLNLEVVHLLRHVELRPVQLFDLLKRLCLQVTRGKQGFALVVDLD